MLGGFALTLVAVSCIGQDPFWGEAVLACMPSLMGNPLKGNGVLSITEACPVWRLLSSFTPRWQELHIETCFLMGPLLAIPCFFQQGMGFISRYLGHTMLWILFLCCTNVASVDSFPDTW